MGRSVSFTHRIEFTHVIGGHMTPGAWRKEYGRPTAANLLAYVKVLNASLDVGGVNYWPNRPMLVRCARIVRQSSGDVMAAVDIVAAA